MYYGIVYLITNKLNGKQYVGKTVGKLKKRWNRHCVEEGCSYLHRAILKHGKENFEIKPIVYANNKEELNYREKFCVRIFNTEAPNGYNLTPGGDGAIKASLPGRELSNEEKNKISKTLKEFYSISENLEKSIIVQPKRKEIICHQNGIVYSSINKAAKELGLSSKSKITDVLNGRINSYRGFTFSLVKNINLNEFKIQNFNITLEDIKVSVKCNETGIIYNSICSAAKQLGLKSKSKISDALNGKLKSYKGLTFSKVERRNVV